MKGYTFKNYDGEHMARAVGMSLPISFKQSVQVSKFIKNRNVSDAKKILQKVMDKEVAIPHKTYDSGIAHKKKIGPGSYPQKTSEHFIRLIEATEANAQFKGLNTSNLVIAHISAHKAAKAWHNGRQSKRKMKRTNIEIVVEEKIVKEKSSSKG